MTKYIIEYKIQDDGGWHTIETTDERHANTLGFVFRCSEYIPQVRVTEITTTRRELDV